MNKAQLIELIQKKLGADTTKKHAEEALAAVLESIKEGVQSAGKVQIIGFGTFATKTREARTGRNPKTGKAIAHPRFQDGRFQGLFQHEGLRRLLPVTGSFLLSALRPTLAGVFFMSRGGGLRLDRTDGGV